MTMKVLLLVAIGAIYTASFTPTLAKDHKAKVLLKFHEHSESYELHKDVLNEITELQRPIRVIAAIGNARVGKSTMLNLISDSWDERSETGEVEKIFKAGDSYEPITRDVWAHIIQPRSQVGTILLLDVEGTDVGDDSVTAQISMFAAMMSSSLNILAINIVGNSNIDFLYRISRMSDLVFGARKTRADYFLKLRIVVRSNLTPPNDLDNYIRDAIFKPNGTARDKGDIISKYFPKENVAVSHLPSVNDVTILNDRMKLRKSSYWKGFDELMIKLRNSPEKRTFEGNPVDGEALTKLAEELVKAMNENEWKDFGNVYSSIEKDICRRSYKKHVEPVLKRSSREIVDMMIETMDKFKENCKLESERQDAMNELKRARKAAREQEEREEIRRKEEEEKRKQEEKQSWFTYENLKTYVPLVASNFFTYYFFSDEYLKNNVTTLPRSQYNNIGLTGICWTWNEVAEMKFGLTGESCGVIAQEVQKLYPWAVNEGKDGYLRVGYHILHQMINHALS